MSRQIPRFVLVCYVFLLIGNLVSCQSLFAGYAESATGDFEQQPIIIYQASENKVTLPPINTPMQTNTAELRTPYEQSPSPSPTMTPPIIGIGNFAPNFNPLTGLELDDWSVINRRPIIVKVSNYPRFGRPHAGLSEADIVFDYYIGFGQNRFAALFYQSNTQIVGPMRSGRLVDGQLGRLYQAAVFYRNADPEVNEGIVERLGDRAIGEADCPPICNIGEYSVASTFGNTQEMTSYLVNEGINNEKPNLSGMLFDPRTSTDGTLIKKISVQFGGEDRAEWVYNDGNGVYERWIEASASTPFEMIPLVDRNTGEQITTENLVVIFAEYETFKPSLHDIHLWDNNLGQKAYFFRDGRMMEGTWRAVSKDRPLQFLDQWGRNYFLKPGNSWIVILDLNSTVSKFNETQIDFKFRIAEE